MGMTGILFRFLLFAVLAVVEVFRSCFSSCPSWLKKLFSTFSVAKRFSPFAAPLWLSFAFFDGGSR
jgi:hypothetical protein